MSYPREEETVPGVSEWDISGARRAAATRNGPWVPWAAYRSSCLSMPERIERALKNVGGRHLVDDFLAAFARRIGVDERARHRGSRKPLVPQHDGDFALGAEIAHEGTGRLHRRSFTAIHVERQTDDEPAHAMFCYQSRKRHDIDAD